MEEGVARASEDENVYSVLLAFSCTCAHLFALARARKVIASIKKKNPFEKLQPQHDYVEKKDQHAVPGHHRVFNM